MKKKILVGAAILVVLVAVILTGVLQAAGEVRALFTALAAFVAAQLWRFAANYLRVRAQTRK